MKKILLLISLITLSFPLFAYEWVRCESCSAYEAESIAQTYVGGQKIFANISIVDFSRNQIRKFNVECQESRPRSAMMSNYNTLAMRNTSSNKAYWAQKPIRSCEGIVHLNERQVSANEYDFFQHIRAAWSESNGTFKFRMSANSRDIPGLADYSSAYEVANNQYAQGQFTNFAYNQWLQSFWQNLYVKPVASLADFFDLDLGSHIVLDIKMPDNSYVRVSTSTGNDQFTYIGSYNADHGTIIEGSPATLTNAVAGNMLSFSSESNAAAFLDYLTRQGVVITDSRYDSRWVRVTITYDGFRKYYYVRRADL